MSKRKRFDIEELHIEKYAAEGKCIGRYQDKVVFVEGVIPGDVVDVYVSKSKKDWAEAGVKRFITESENRIAPFCMHFGICGGCKWQMLPYPLQLDYKEQQVKDQLVRIGKIQVEEYLPIKGCTQTAWYRNKLEFTFSNKQYLSSADLKSGMSFDKNVLGFHAPRLFDKVIDIETCHLQAEPSNHIKNFIRDFAFQHHITFYDIRNHIGLLRTLIIRVSSTGEILVNMVFGEKDLEKISFLMQAVHEKFPEITSLNYTINEKMNDSIYDQEVVLFAGKDSIEEKLEDFVFKISPKSFFQTNPLQTVNLYSIVRDFADCNGNEILYDLYCGTGSIGIFLSKAVQKIIGVETVADAVADARLNAATNNLQNVRFYEGDVIKICNDAFFALHGNPDIVIIDPPRAGCHEALIEKLLELEVKKIVYVSCNPATQARDLQWLSAKYDIKKSQAVDMFPQTHHVENVVLLHLKAATNE
nr:23S rRNA (uracil(1939)-C(5))-methyltransferase RlmD [Chitinophagaceae bacterium]